METLFNKKESIFIAGRVWQLTSSQVGTHMSHAYKTNSPQLTIITSNIFWVAVGHKWEMVVGQILPHKLNCVTMKATINLKK